MDDLTHVLAGGLIGRANPSARKGLTLACVLGALAPDIDNLYTLGTRELYLTEHRAFTHSYLGFLPMALLASALAWLFMRRRLDRASFLALFGMSLLGVLSHLFLDLCTSWGTMLLWPDKTRFALDHLSIVDPWYTSLLILPLALSYFWKARRVRICVIGLVLVAGYHCLASFNHHRALSIVEKDRPGVWAAAFPQLFSPFRWSAYNRENGSLKEAQIDFLKSDAPLKWEKWQEPPKTRDIQAAMDSPEGKQFLWFARVPMWSAEGQTDGTTIVYFWDMRFRDYKMREKVSHHFSARFVVKDGKVIQGKL
jgi:membrane-bound metal-dependent hydrolase YbcI (DUF457 family)